MIDLTAFVIARTDKDVAISVLEIYAAKSEIASTKNCLAITSRKLGWN